LAQKAIKGMKNLYDGNPGENVPPASQDRPDHAFSKKPGAIHPIIHKSIDPLCQLNEEDDEAAEEVGRPMKASRRQFLPA
jgi:hypothetical protein